MRRAGEPSFLCYEGLKWNALFETATIEAPQSKSNKVKYIPLLAGSCRHSDILLDWGDFLVFDGGRTEYHTEKKTHILPELIGTDNGKGAATKVRVARAREIRCRAPPTICEIRLPAFLFFSRQRVAPPNVADVEVRGHLDHIREAAPIRPASGGSDLPR